jgi:hypothetical protein
MRENLYSSLTWHLLMVIEPVLASLRETLRSFEGGSEPEWKSQFGFVHDEWHEPGSRIEVPLPRLEGLPPSHWIGTFNGQTAGFLSFHHEAIASLNNVRRSPYNPLNLRAIGHPFPNEYYQIGDPHIFSFVVEQWHNGVHRDPRFGPEFLDPAHNVHLDVFWQFHQAVEEIYMTYLKNHGLAYEDVNHEVV